MHVPDFHSVLLLFEPTHVRERLDQLLLLRSPHTARQRPCRPELGHQRLNPALECAPTLIACLARAADSCLQRADGVCSLDR
jgi:hypothetical protein